MIVQRRQSIRTAALAALALAATAADPVRAAPGLSPGVLLIHNQATGPDDVVGTILCFSVSGGTIAWTQVEDARYRNPKTKVEVRITTAARVESFDAAGRSAAQLIGPATAFASCPAVDTRGRATTSVAESQPAILLNKGALQTAADTVGPLYVSALGSPASPIPGVTGIAPRVATFPDGSAIVAWLALAPGTTADDPAFEVYAARRLPDGTFSPPQLLSAAGSVDRERGTRRLVLAPEVVADPDGSAEVAWSLLADRGRDSIVQVSQAPPGDPFGPPQTLAQPGTPAQGAVGVLRFASGGSGHHVIEFQRVDKSANVGLQLAGQSGAGAAYTAIPELYARAVDSGPTPGGLAMDDAGDLLSLTSPDTTLDAIPDDLAVLRRPAGGADFGAPQFLVEEGDGDALIVDSALAVAPDGRAAAAWTQILPAPFRGITARLMLSTAPPGGRFGPPVAVTGIAPLADNVALTYDADGRLRIVWSAATSILGGEDVYGAVSVPGAVDGVTARGPRLRVLRTVSPRPRGVTVALNVGRPGTVRVHVSVPRAGIRLAIGDEAGRTVAHAGVIRVPVDLGGRIPRRAHLTADIVAYATDSRGASSAVHVHRRFRR